MAGLGDRVELALTSLGITSQLVERWLGDPCGCKERKEKLNALDLWARRVVIGKVQGAKEYLEELLQWN